MVQAIEEKVLAGAENILRAYSANNPEMCHEAKYGCEQQSCACSYLRSLMVQDAKNKITFLKMELLRQSKQGRAKPFLLPSDVCQ